MNKKNFAIVLLLSIAVVNNVQSMDDGLYRDYVPEDFDPLVEQADRFAQAQEEALNNLLPSWKQAVTDNDINQVSDILYLMHQNRISVSEPLDSEGNTALMLAALARRLVIVQHLIFNYFPTREDVQNVLDRLDQGQRFPNDENLIKTLRNYRDGIYNE